MPTSWIHEFSREMPKTNFPGPGSGFDEISGAGGVAAHCGVRQRHRHHHRRGQGFQRSGSEIKLLYTAYLPTTTLGMTKICAHLHLFSSGKLTCLKNENKLVSRKSCAVNF